MVTCITGRSMRRRSVLKLIAIGPAHGLIGGCWTEHGGSAETSNQPKVFYVSPTGNDSAPGLTVQNPWKTISHVNSELTKGTVGPNDSVLFECGRTFYGKIRPPTREAARRGYLTIGSYRSREDSRRPTISSYKLLNNVSGWTPASPGIWRIDLSDAKAGLTHTGYDGAEGGGSNVGFLKIDGVIHGKRVWRLSDLVDQWDFYCAGSVLHVQSTANPATLSRDIRAACDGDCIRLVNSLRVTGLRLEGSGGHGIQGSASHVRVDNNEFAELGGSRLGGTTRYGNGFQAWIDSANIVVERNVFHDIYDVALTAQGGPSSSTGSWKNVVFHNNLVYACNQSVEFWSDGIPGGGPGFVNCIVECNTCLYAGYGWSAAVRPDQDTRVHLLTYGWALPADIQVRRNTFYDGSGAYRYSSTSAEGMVCSDNLIYQRRGGLLKVGDPQTIEQWPNWVAAQGNDLNSTFVTRPGKAEVDVPSALRQVAGQGAGCSPPPLP